VVQAGFDIDERVVRRHVAKLETAGWLMRSPWIWGEGSVVWLTGAGIDAAGLGGVQPVSSTPANTTVAHGVLAGFSAARAERRGNAWRSSRELDPDRWAVPIRSERGYTNRLPDVAVWPQGWTEPGAIIAESGQRRYDRQRMILEGWRDAIAAGRYHVVRYDCASPSVAQWIARLAKKAGLSGSQFTAVVQTTAEQIAALSPAAAPSSEPGVEKPQPAFGTAWVDRASIDPPSSAPQPPQGPVPAPSPRLVREAAEAAADRERIYREVFGMDDQKPRRRWHR
jgi:hypothetical protein